MLRAIFCALAIFFTSLSEASPRTLVVILGETRAHELTYQSFKRNVLDILNADLAVCIGVKENYDYDNPFYQNAKYHFLYDEPTDYGPLYDEAYELILENNPPAPENALHWREFLKIKDQYLGGILDTENQHGGAGGILIYCRWYLLKNLLDRDLLNQYDYFIITRSDFIYQLPHPRMEIFSPDSIYLPDGEKYGGVTDRHVVLPRKFVVAYLDILEQMIHQGKDYYGKLSQKQPVNTEKAVKFNLEYHQVFQNVKFFPYIMYAVRASGAPTRWSSGTYSEKHGYYIKYASEYKAAEKHRQSFLQGTDSLDKFYQKRIRKP
jgi:hypothetical protein